MPDTIVLTASDTMVVTTSVTRPNIPGPTSSAGPAHCFYSSPTPGHVLIRFIRKTSNVLNPLQAIIRKRREYDGQSKAEVKRLPSLPRESFPFQIPGGRLPLFIKTLCLFLICSCIVPVHSAAQDQSPYDEVIFGFTLKDLGSYNISVAIKNDKVFLPAIELFNIFEVYYTIEGQNIIKGTYVTSAFPMVIDPVKHEIDIGDKQYVTDVG